MICLKRLALFFLIFTLSFVFPLLSHAEEEVESLDHTNDEKLLSIIDFRNPSNDTKSRKGNVLSITFEDELIKGEIQNPDILSVLQNSGAPRNKKIIKLRNHFRPEMRQAAKIIF